MDISFSQSASSIITDDLDEKYSEEAPEAFPEGPPNPLAQHLPRLC